MYTQASTFVGGNTTDYYVNSTVMESSRAWNRRANVAERSTASEMTVQSERALQARLYDDSHNFSAPAVEGIMSVIGKMLF